MTRSRPLLAAAVLAVAGGLAACAAQPYIHSPELINREHPDFATERTDRGTFTVCYATWETSPEDVRDLAIEECRRYEKRAAFVDTTLRTCPLAAPAGATYACLGEGQSLADVLAADQRRRAEIEDQLDLPPDGEPRPMGGSGWSSATDPAQ